MSGMATCRLAGRSPNSAQQRMNPKPGRANPPKKEVPSGGLTGETPVRKEPRQTVRIEDAAFRAAGFIGLQLMLDPRERTFYLPRRTNL